MIEFFRVIEMLIIEFGELLYTLSATAIILSLFYVIYKIIQYWKVSITYLVCIFLMWIPLLTLFGYLSYLAFTNALYIITTIMVVLTFIILRYGIEVCVELAEYIIDKYKLRGGKDV